MLDDILNAVVADMQADVALAEVTSYHKVEGMVPGLKPTISVWVPKQKFTEYTNDEDECNAEIHIGVSVHDMQPERGEQHVRTLAKEIRLLLTADDHTLGGLIDDSFLSEWEFESIKPDQTLMLHLGEAVWQVKYYEPRNRTVTPGESMDELDFTETIV